MDEEKKLNAGEVTDGAEGAKNGPRCPNCGSDNTTVDLAILQYFCEDCGYRWEM